MEPIKAKLAAWSQDRALVRIAAAAVAAMLILVSVLCISLHMRSNIQKKYSATVAQLREQTFQSLKNMTELFGRVDDPNVDVRYKLIPELKAQYAAVAAMNGVLLDNCGEKEAVLSAGQMDAFDAAFESYALAYSQGIATGLARADMAACIAEAQQIVELHYNPPKDDADKIVVINASSGEVEKK